MDNYITLPWPDFRLSPNFRAGWKAKLEVKKLARDDGFWRAKMTGVDPPPNMKGDLSVTLTFHPPDKRRRDLDNMLASLKPSLDGICKAWKIDDSQFKVYHITWGEVIEYGEVRISIEACHGHSSSSA